MLQDWNKLKFFTIVAKHQNISKAANELNMSQPALSRQITALEHTLNLQLFVRTSKGLSLTEAGTNLYNGTMKIYQAITASTKSLTPSKLTGELKIISNYDFASLFLAEKVTTFMELNPKLNIILEASNTFNMAELTKSPTILFQSNTQSPNTCSSICQSFKLGLYINNDYYAALNKSPSPLNIQQLPYITLNNNHPDYSIINKEALKLINLNNTTTLCLNSFTAILIALKSTAAISLLPEYLVTAIPNNLRLLQNNIDFSPLLYYSIYTNNFANNQLILAFLNFITNN